MALFWPTLSQASSPKRGLGWDEKTVKLNNHHAALLEPGASWVYNWGATPGNPDIYSEDFCFIPMAWNANFDETKIRNWLRNHPETRYLLGFNEPNFADQARMTPAEAAAAWPRLEAIAREFDVKLVAPALNFSSSQVGGKVWGIYEWYDEFFRLYPAAKVDCLALHCYMNWYTATEWFATEYFYHDLFDTANENYGRYPYLAKYLTDYRATNGHYPRMMLTEFCAWEADYLPDVEFQIDQMTQKVQKLEQSDLVEGYAWFLANPSGGPTAFPYMSVFEANSANAGLSELGKIYVNMSTFNTSRYYLPGELIMAKDYIDATTGNQQVKVRSNSESESSIPLQIEIPERGSTSYKISTPANGKYTFTLHCSATPDARLTLKSGGTEKGSVEIPVTDGEWTDVSIETGFPAGHQTIQIFNAGSFPILINSLKFDGDPSAVESIHTDSYSSPKVYTVAGHCLGSPDPASLPSDIYILRYPDGQSIKINKP